MNRCRSDYCSDYKRQKAEFQIFIATNVATTVSETQKFWISWLVQNENRKLQVQVGHLHDRTK